ncbi:MAG: type IV secretion system DNA-binding domain-containing protein [Planctomycetia bacterium]|nr:type IV secretion system DNA-binding domain-containing protein [Planctomycetia bacterium]
MFKSILNKAKDMAGQIATPENFAKARDMAASAGATVAKTAAKVQDHAQQRTQSGAQKQAAAIASHHISAAIDASPGGNIHRGTVILDCTTPAMLEKLHAKTTETTITVGAVPISPDDEQQHILLCGAPGTGKSVEIKKALRTIRKRGQRCVVYDVSGELVSLYYRPGIDHILNPLDARSDVWNPWLDAESFEYAALAKSLIPDPRGQADPFWTEGGRATFEALLMQSPDLDALVSTGLSAPLPELAGLVRDAGFEGMIGAEKTFQSTRSTLAVYLRALAMLPNVSRNDPTAFSIRRWLEADDGSWLFLSVPSRGREALRPLVSLWLDTVVRQAMSLRPDPNRRVWLSLDELPSLQKIPSLAPALAEGRKFGLSAITGVQTFPQLQEIYGKELASALWGLMKTRLYLRIADADTCETVSKEIGDQQLRRETQSSSNSTSRSSGSGGPNGGSSSNSDSSSTSEQIVTERAVLPSQIAGLPDLVGYLRTGGSSTVARVKVEFDGLPRQGEQPNFMDQPQRALPKYRAPDQGQGTVSNMAAREVEDAHYESPTGNMQETTTSTAQETPTMESLMQQYSVSIANETRNFCAEYGDEFLASLTDEDIENFAEIMADRVDVIHAVTQEG